jgi:hypothetical protein
MTLRIDCLSVDADDPPALAGWWADVLGWEITGEDEGDEVAVEPPAGTTERDAGQCLLFVKVPERKTIKNRLHLDLRPDDQAAEVARVEAMGARRTSVGQGDDVTWVVLADPEGNEFCILRAKEA